MKGKVFAIRKKFKGVITVVVDVPIGEYSSLDPRKKVDIQQVEDEAL